jgi:antibiotic biosynthesis monooxygenase (ABM) superfamily enzyme
MCENATVDDHQPGYIGRDLQVFRGSERKGNAFRKALGCMYTLKKCEGLMSWKGSAERREEWRKENE